MTIVHELPGNSKAIEASFSSRQCHFDIKNGAKPPESADIAHWGSALRNVGCLDRQAPLLAMGIIKKYALGLPESEQLACVD
jgi:hypothetical protein